MKVYLAGPLFSVAERALLEDLCHHMEQDGFDVFLPHRDVGGPTTPHEIFSADYAGLATANVLVAWLDGSAIDDGTACEIGMFSELCRTDPARHYGLIGFLTDWRAVARRTVGLAGAGLNLFVVGAIERYGAICWTQEELLDRLREMRRHAFR
jgi:nucleoside 2-deoxyribosyltransferase